MKYILDTNIISEILKDNEKTKSFVQNLLIEGKEILINAISYYEVKRGLLKINASTKLKKFESLCNVFPILLLDEKNIFDIASKIYVDLEKEGKLISDNDIYIASITLCKDFILISNDTDFERIKNLKTIHCS
jgi:predicted nucleic acid-binding protein